MPPISPYSAVPLSAAMAPKPGLSIAREGDGVVMENAGLRLFVNAAGQVSTMVDKSAGRSVLSEPGNVLQIFEDRPLVWDAWDIDPFFEDRMEVLDSPAVLEIVEDTPHRVSLRVTRSFKSSRLSQEIRLTAASNRVDFVTDVDWYETHTLMKVAFPTTLLSPRATYDIQWGHIERPTHRNPSWDAAKYEVCGHQWADLSDGGCGVAVLNDCKYGYDIRDHVMRLSLIKSATMPDVGADQGAHHFTYALFPHAGGWQGKVEPEAAALNHPVRVTGGVPVPPVVVCTAPNVVIETLKPADHGLGFVLRAYESHRIACTADFQVPGWVTRASVCDLMEDEIASLEVDNGVASVPLTPFQIVTLRFQ